ncbi:MAG: hypothetical protein IPM12_09690 [Flavobacteriales bacterium]|nr:hypothetical protein [Flavobacteriales bacterium]
MRRLLPFLLTAAISPQYCTAQAWVELMLDESVPIHEVKAAFDAHWQGQPYERGQGWKQFQRWHWFMEQRCGTEGTRLDPSIYSQAKADLEALRNQRGARDEAVWEPLGPSNWLSISYNPGNGRVNCTATHPGQPEVIYAGTPASGLWRSSDNGSTWEPLYTDLSSMGVSGIAIDTSGTGAIYIATGDGDGADTYSQGVLKSIDDGATWSTTGLNWNITQTRTTRALRMDPTNAQRLYCAASNGLYRTLDGADTWQQLSTGSFRDVEFKPGDPTQVYACTDRFYRSTAGGEIVSPTVNDGLPTPDLVGRMAIAVSPSAPEVVYALCSNEEDNSYLGLWRSTDAGLTFELRSDSPNIFSYSENGSGSGGQAWYDMALAVDPGNADIVYVGGINVWRSVNGGASWQIKSHWVYPAEVGYTHADIHSLDIHDGKLYCGSDGGIYVTGDSAESWSDLSAGLDIMQFYRMGSSESMPGLIMAGAQDNGSNRYVNGEWTHVFGADGMEAAVDPFNADNVFSSSQNGGLRRSSNGGVDWTSLTDDMFEEGAWVTPFAMDPQVPGRMFAGFNNLLYSEDHGDNWVDMTGWPTTEFVRCLAIAPSNSDVWYVAREDKVARLTDEGFTQVNIRPGLPQNQAPTSISVDPEDAFHLWISYSGQHASNKIFESTNGGATWINRSAGLPNVPANSVVCQPNSPNGVYLGTDLGVFYRDDYTNAWEPYGTGMPNVVVSELEINMAIGKLRAATYGRGIWEADLFFSPFASVAESIATSAPMILPVDHEGRYRLVLAAEHGALRQLRVIDASGRIILQGFGAGQLIDLSSRAPSAYTVQVLTDKGIWSRRVLR